MTLYNHFTPPYIFYSEIKGKVSSKKQNLSYLVIFIKDIGISFQTTLYSVCKKSDRYHMWCLDKKTTKKKYFFLCGAKWAD